MAVTLLSKNGLPQGVSAPYDWALEQMRAPEAHAVTRGSKDVIVAVIDIAYHYHPDHAGHLWVNPRPLRGDVHGWDFDQEDATLEYEGPPYDATKHYFRDHGAFLVGEIAAVAPDCRIMTLRAAYNRTNQGGWVRAIDYAVAHGARIIVLSHCYIAKNKETGESLFHQGTDFTYPTENPALIDAFDRAYDAGCLVFRGAGDNRGRRMVSPISAVDSSIPVGSTNRHGAAASIAPATAYTEFAAPCGEGTDDPRDTIWGTGGNGEYVSFHGGCMANGFGAGVAALLFSQYPQFSNEEIRQILRNTARGEGWDPWLGHGTVDAHAGVSLRPEQLCRRLQVQAERCTLRRDAGRLIVDVAVENGGVFDIKRALAVLYTGDPLTPADPAATMEEPNILIRRQLGHAIAPVPGLERVRIPVELDGDTLPVELWVQVSALDRGAAGVSATARLPISNTNA